MKRLLLGAVLFALFAGNLNAQAPNSVWTAPFGPGGTWNIYEVYLTTDTWVNAHNRTFTTTDSLGLGVKGHLVSLHSAAENNWVHLVAGGGDVSIGLVDRVGVQGQDLAGNTFDLGASESQGTADNRTMGWKWTSGEAFSYQNWSGGEPNDFNAAEDMAHLGGNTLWNDNGSGYAAGVPVADPNSNSEGAPVFKYVIEYEANLADPTDLIAVGALKAGFLPPAPLPGPSGGNGFWGIREVSGLGGAAHVREAYEKLASGAGTISDGMAPVVNHNDPQTNGAGSGLITPDMPFLADTAVDDQDFQMVAHGRVQIPGTGAQQHTFGFHSDDGAALRLRDSNGAYVPWDSSSGALGVAAVDASDPTILTFPYPTGDSNTRGVITLQGGQTYDIEFVSYENAGGAYWEVYSAPGAHINDADAPFRLVGHKKSADVVKPGIGPNGWIIAQDPNGGALLNNFAEANAALDAAIADSTAIIVENVASVNYIDPQTNGVPTGSFGADIPFPGDSGADDNDFAIRGFAELVIPADGTYQFGFRGDDGGYIRITGGPDTNGGNFASILANATGLSQIQENGDLLICDCLTGDSNTLGESFLAAGTYSIEVGFFERGGGAWFEVFGSGPNSGQMLLMTGGAAVTPDVDGLQLVPEPSTYAWAILALSAGVIARRRRK